MSAKAVAVHHWPRCGNKLEPESGPIVVAIETPRTAIRVTARALVRKAAREIIATLLNRDSDSIPLIASAGIPPRIEGQDGIYLSISHESGLSLLAISVIHPVGVDILESLENPPWKVEIPALAKDYFGAALAEKLTGLDSTIQARNFAQEWTKHEARLKCLSIPLTEWTAQLTAHPHVQISTLDLPTGYYGALATMG